jgi:hypothetical protein
VASAASHSLAAGLDGTAAHQTEAWVRSSALDIHARLVGVQFRLESELQGDTHRRQKLVKTKHLDGPPPLPPQHTCTEAIPTELSVSTGLVSHFDAVSLLQAEGVLEGAEVLESPRISSRGPLAFECTFWFLSCGFASNEHDEWRHHCLSHFRGEEPPRYVRCPLCNDFEHYGANGWIAWDYRQNHLASHHRGQTLTTSQPDFHLFQHLWRKRLISDQELKTLSGGDQKVTPVQDHMLLISPIQAKSKLLRRIRALKTRGYQTASVACGKRRASWPLHVLEY